MPAWKRGSNHTGNRREDENSGRWSSHRRVPVNDDDYIERTRSHNDYHRSKYGNASTPASATENANSRRPHSRRRERSRGRRRDYDGNDTDASFSDVSCDGPHSRRSRHHKRQRRESSHTRHHNYNNYNYRSLSPPSSSLSRRESRDHHRERHRHRRHREEKEEGLHGNDRRKPNKGVSSKHATSAGAEEERQKQLLSALDKQLASYRGPNNNSNDNNNNKNNNSEREHESCAPSHDSSPSTRVVLYGVDLGVQQCHVDSMLEQLIGRRPLRVFRPAAELWQSQCESTSSESRHARATADGFLHLGLHDVSGAGGVMVVELPRDGDFVAAAVSALNGACINGRVIAAVVN